MLNMLGVYNLVSVLTALILAWPYFFKHVNRAKRILFVRPFKSSWKRLRRPSKRVEDAQENDMEGPRSLQTGAENGRDEEHEADEAEVPREAHEANEENNGYEERARNEEDGQYAGNKQNQDLEAGVGQEMVIAKPRRRGLLLLRNGRSKTRRRDEEGEGEQQNQTEERALGGIKNTAVIRSLPRIWPILRLDRSSKETQTIEQNQDVRVPNGEQLEEVNIQEMTPMSLFFSVLGSIVISISSPVLAAFSLWRQHHNQANLWVLIQQWATRPRATCIVFGICWFFRCIENPGYELETGFDSTALSTMIAEVPLSLFAVNFLTDQAQQTIYPANQTYVPPIIFGVTLPVMDASPYVKLQYFSNLLVIFIYVHAGMFAVCFTVPIVIGAIHPLWPIDESVRKAAIRGLSTLWPGTITIYAFSWAIWHCFLVLTPEQLYCVQDTAWVDVIYCLLPLALALWRATVAALNRRIPKARQGPINEAPTVSPNTQDSSAHNSNTHDNNIHREDGARNDGSTLAVVLTANTEDLAASDAFSPSIHYTFHLYICCEGSVGCIKRVLSKVEGQLNLVTAYLLT